MENLPRNLQVTALCGLGIGAAFSADTAILHSFFASAAYDDAVFGTDLREFGKQRQEAVRHLLRNAMDAANEAGVVFHPSIENATSCYMLDVLMRLSKPPLLLLTIFDEYTQLTLPTRSRGQSRETYECPSPVCKSIRFACARTFCGGRRSARDRSGGRSYLGNSPRR